MFYRYGCYIQQKLPVIDIRCKQQQHSRNAKDHPSTLTHPYHFPPQHTGFCSYLLSLYAKNSLYKLFFYSSIFSRSLYGISVGVSRPNSTSNTVAT